MFRDDQLSSTDEDDACLCLPPSTHSKMAEQEFVFVNYF
jgi:hypothetical protein